jgi:hypothetical protein
MILTHLSNIWRTIVAACESKLEPSTQGLKLTDAGSQPDPHPELYLSASVYRAIPKDLELRPALTVGVVAEVLVLSTGWCFVFWHDSGHSVLTTLSCVFVLAIASVLIRLRRRDSLALAGDYLIGPNRSFGKPLMRLPLRGLVLDGVNADLLRRARRFGGVVHFRHVNGLSIRFAPYIYPRVSLEAFLERVRQAHHAAT